MRTPFPLKYVLLFAIFTVQSVAQLPDNFQFLDHRGHKTGTSVIKVNENQIFFTDSYSVQEATSEYNLKRKAGFLYNSSSQRLFEVNDSSFHIILCELSEIDVTVEGFFIYSKSGSEESTITKLIPISSSNGYYRSVLPDAEGGAYVLDFENDLLHFKNNGQIDTLISGEHSSIAKLFLYTNCRDSVFIFNENHNKIFRRNGEFNYICDDGFRLRKYDCDFDNILHEWTLPDSVSSFQQIQFLPNDALYMDIILDPHTYQLLQIDSDSNVEILYEAELGPNEHVKGAHIIDDTTHILHGIHFFEHTENQFFRTVHSNYNPEYKLSDIEIASYTILEIEDQKLEYKLAIQNNSEDTIGLVCAFYDISDDKLYKFFTLSISDAIHPGDVVCESTITTPDSIPDFVTLFENIPVEVQGADFKFLESGPQYIMPEISTTNTITPFNNEVVIYPNPVESDLFVLPENAEQIFIFDANGQLLHKQTIQSETIKMDVSDFSAGTYFGILSSDKGKERIFKFIKTE